jgi:uncharacterized protein (TIRG00374 family)
MKKQNFSTFLAVVVTIILVSFFLLQIDMADLIDALKQINPVYLVFGFGLYLCSYIFRTCRFYILLDKEINVKDLFYVVCVHNLVNNILPARTGELSYVYMLKKLHSRSMSEGIASLTVVRFFDLITIFFLFFISVSRIQIKSQIITNSLWFVTLFMSIVVLLFLSLFFYGDRSISGIKKILRILGLGNKKSFVYLSHILEEITKSFEKIKSFRKIIFFELMVLSFGAWLSLYLFNYILIKTLNIDLDFPTVIFSTSFAVFTTVLPIQGIGGFGTLEGGWSAGLIAAGLKSEVAICSAFIFHMVMIMYFLVLGLLGFFGMKLKK